MRSSVEQKSRRGGKRQVARVEKVQVNLLKGHKIRIVVGWHEITSQMQSWKRLLGNLRNLWGIRTKEQLSFSGSDLSAKSCPLKMNHCEYKNSKVRGSSKKLNIAKKESPFQVWPRKVRCQTFPGSPWPLGRSPFPWPSPGCRPSPSSTSPPWFRSAGSCDGRTRWGHSSPSKTWRQNSMSLIWTKKADTDWNNQGTPTLILNGEVSVRQTSPLTG